MTPPAPDDKLPVHGRVVAAHGRTAIVEDQHRNKISCAMKGKQLRAVCADNVMWRPEQSDAGNGIILEILKRETELARPDSRGRPETVAANMSQLLIVVAPRPAADFSLIDRYLVAAELNGIKAAVIANKTDLGELQLKEFAAIGYPVLGVCAKKPESLDPLRELLTDH
ncbi:MAG: GTPase RsgA, partial [Gammaproteobacteria bacterium]|nr:GTPase RsgA [Gammaproteobacteria bacterium]